MVCSGRNTGDAVLELERDRLGAGRQSLVDGEKLTIRDVGPATWRNENRQQVRKVQRCGRLHAWLTDQFERGAQRQVDDVLRRSTQVNQSVF